MFNSERTVEYDVERMDNCDCKNKGCAYDRIYGVQTNIKEIWKPLDLFSITLSKDTDIQCPEHRDEHQLSEKARQMEHKAAREEYHRHQRSVFKSKLDNINDKITSIPVFIYNQKNNNKIRMTDNKRFNIVNVETYEDARNFIENIDINRPHILHDNREKISIIGEDSNTITYSYLDEVPSVEELQSRFENYDYNTREYFIIQTNQLTGEDATEPIHKLEGIIESVIERNEYKDIIGNAKPPACPYCNRSIRNTYRLTRCIIDGEEKIVCTHKRNKRIIGELNNNIIDKELYEIK